MKSTPSRGGKKYFITFIDDCTRFCYVYLLNSKDEAIDAFKQHKNEVENQLNLNIKLFGLIGVENMNLLLQRYVWNMVLFIKLLDLIHHSQMVWQNGRTEH